MPEITENYIHIPVRNANQFIQESFRTIDISKSQKIEAVVGKLKSDPNSGMKVEKYIFNKDKWDMESAQKWVNDHKSMTDILMGENEIIDFNDDKERKMEKIKKLYTVESKDFNDDEKSFIATASTEDVDRDGDILTLAGWKLKNYKRNPVVLWQHDASIMPIGKAEDVWIEDNKLKFKPIFAPKDVNPFGEQVYNAYKKGFLTSFSVRFDPVTWEDIPPKSDNTIRNGRIYKSHELLEISAVNIPANPEATKTADMIDFVVKSYLYENKSNIDLDLKELYAKSDDTLKEKINQLINLKGIKEKHLEEKKIKDIEQFVDEEIKKLTAEIELHNKKIELEKSIKELKAGITSLSK